MKNKKHSANSRRWLQAHFKDKYVIAAQKKGLRSRAWFKLEEIQQQDKIFTPTMRVIELGASPGGWSQYIATIIGKRGKLIACDILPMNVIENVDFIQGDFRDEATLAMLLACLEEQKADVILSDMAPNMCGIPVIDIPRAFDLAELALEMCHAVLASKGSFLVKVFQGEGFDAYLKNIRALFEYVKIRKPDASSKKSREVYIVARGWKVKSIEDNTNKVCGD